MGEVLSVPNDRIRAIGVLFLRVLQRESTEAPSVIVAPGKGSGWIAGVFIGAPPTEMLAHYLRSGAPGSDLPARAPTITDANRFAVADSGDGAIDKLEVDLRRALEARLRADAEAWQRATGTRWEVPDFPEPTPAQPGVDDFSSPGQPVRARRALPR